MVSTAPPSIRKASALRIERTPGQLREARRVDAFGEPQPHQQKFVGNFVRLQHFVDGKPVAIGLDQSEPGFRFLFGLGGVTASVDIEPAMRARTDAGIFMAAPVNKIVPALRARPRMIGHFVSRQAGLAADRLREIVKIAAEILVRHDQFAGLVQAEERRARFNGELIEREMFGRFGDGAFEFGLPAFKRLARPRIDQIEGVTIEDRTRDGNRVERFLRGVQAAQFLQRLIVKRLHAERYAIDAGGAVAAKACRLDAGRIGLERNLGVAGDGPVLADGIENRFDSGGLHQRRRAAAEENRRHATAARARRRGGDFLVYRLHVMRFVITAVADMAVEVAIGALRQAERPVHINGEFLTGEGCRGARCGRYG